MERLFSLLFALAIAGVGLSLDYYGARQVTPGLALSEHVADRFALLTGRAPRGASVVEVAEGAEAGPGAAQVLALALGALRAAGGSPAAATGDPAAAPPAAPGTAAALAAQAAKTFGEVSQALAAGSPAPGAAAVSAAPAAPKPSILKVSGGLSGGACATKAGSKFCSAGKADGN
ncbi:MAG: hypothetical protein ACKVPY_13205 [Paracoccaceae bacterium]